MPDRTRDILKKRASTNQRKIRWRARQKEKKLAAEVAAKLARAIERDRRRMEKGLLPIKEVNREKVRKFREKQADLKSMISQSWFAPTLSESEFHDYAKEHGWDASQATSRFESFNRVAAVCEVNLNLYLLRHYGQGAEDARLRFHESWLQTQEVGKALEAAKTIKIQFEGRNSIYTELNRQARYEAARERWGAGSEIVAALLGKTAV